MTPSNSQYAETSGLDDDPDDDWDDVEIDNTYLTFELAGAEYAVAVGNVKEIVRLPSFVEVPDVPDFIRGVMNLRGQVIPLMDARRRLGLPEIEYSDRTVAIVLESDGVSTGLVADGVNGVADIPPGSIDEAASGRNRGGRVRAVKGVGHVEGAVSIILDASRLLGDEAVEAVASFEANA